MITPRKFIAIFLLALAVASAPSFVQSHALQLGRRMNGAQGSWTLSGRPSDSRATLAAATSGALTDSTQAQAAIGKISPAVVSIYGYKTATPSPDATIFTLPFFNLTISVPNTGEMEVDAGSGFLVRSDGYLLTCAHVVSDPSATYQVVLADGSTHDAEVVYRDAQQDIAVMKIPGSNYPTVELGDSAGLRVGQTVLGMGNAFGQFSNFTSGGTVSSLHEEIVPSNADTPGQHLQDLFQSSMQLYPGHSGGPTFDTNGKVVGINDAIASNYRNVSFSIPINYAKNILAAAVPTQAAPQTAVY